MLGEVSCLAITKSDASIICDTYCEFQTLNFVDLYKTSRSFQSVRIRLGGTFKNRVNYAKWAKSDQVPKVDPALERGKYLTPVMTLKRQWRHILQLSHMKTIEDREWNKFDRTFTSTYLDLLVISDVVQMKVNAICLKPSCPYVMNPDSSFRVFLDYFVVSGVLLELFLLPYPVFFLRHVGTSLMPIMTILDIIYVCDVCLELTTAVKLSRGKMITKPSGILLHCSKNVSFILDIISILPYDTISNLLNISKRLASFLKIPRLVKVHKVLKLIHQYERSLFVNNLYVRLIKYILLYGIIIYWTCCIMYATSCEFDECRKDRWYQYNIDLRGITTTYDRFEKTLFFAMSILLNVTLTDNTFFSTFDMAMSICIIYVGYFMYSFCFSELAASAVMSIQQASQHQDDIVMFKVILKRRLVHKELKVRLLNILEFNWRYNEGAEIQGKNAILSEASDNLKAAIINER